jgi:hypothetical protein
MSIEVFSAAMGDNRAFQPPSANAPPSVSGIPGLSSAAYRHTEQLLVQAGILATVGQDSSLNKNSNNNRTPSDTSGIVSHLRSSLSPRQDVESSLRARGQQLARGHDLEKALSLARYRHAISMYPNVNRYAAASFLGQSSAINPNLAMLPSTAAMLSSRFSVPRTLGGTAIPKPSFTQDPALLAMLASSGLGASGLPSVSTARPPRKRSPIVLFMECDEDSLSEYQCLIRQQIELFEADKEEAASSVQGRNKQIVEGQVGIRCRHCTVVPPRRRQKGCMYFPTKLDRIYQAAQNLSAFHLCEHCKHVPADVRKKILVLRERKSPAGGGKRYWGEGVRCLGVIEESNGLRFK